MKKCKVTLSAELGEQSIETFLSDDAYHILLSFERAFKLNRQAKHQPILEVFTLPDSGPKPSDLSDVRETLTKEV